MIQGDGFFVVNNGGDGRCTPGPARSSFDAAGNLVTSTAAWSRAGPPTRTATSTPTGPLSKITLPLGTTVPPMQTDQRRASSATCRRRRRRLGPDGQARRVRRRRATRARSPSTFTKVDAPRSWDVSLDDGDQRAGHRHAGLRPARRPARARRRLDAELRRRRGRTSATSPATPTMDTIAARHARTASRPARCRRSRSARTARSSGVFSNGVKQVAGADRPRHLQQPDRPGQGRRLDVPASTVNSGLAADRHRRQRLARHPARRHPGDVERRPGPGVHQPDHRPARLPGELAGHHAPPTRSCRTWST